MPSLRNLAFLCIGLVVGGLLQAWLWSGRTKDSVRPPGPLEALDYGDLLRDPKFGAKAADFLLTLDDNCPETPAERVLAVALLQQRYGAPGLAGYQISSHAIRYHGAQSLITDHLIQDAPAEHRARVERLRKILRQLVEAEGDYCGWVLGGTGAYRDRTMEHNLVEEAVSRWALRLAKEPGARNPDAPGVFMKLRQRLDADQESLRRLYKGDELGPMKLRNALQYRPRILSQLAALANELKGWPPEVAEELEPLILQTFQN